MTRPQPPQIKSRYIEARSLMLGGTVIASGLFLNLTVLGLAPRPSIEISAAQVAAAADVARTDDTAESAAVAAPVLAQSAPPPTVTTLEPINAPAPPPTDPAQSLPVTAPPSAPEPPTTPASPAPTIPVATAPVAPPVTAPPVTAPPTTAPPVTAPPVTAPPTTAPPTTTATTAPPTTASTTVEYPEYAISKVGSVVLTYTNRSTISLYAVYSGSGWVYEVEKDGPRQVTLKFFNIQTEQEAEWTAKIENSRIKVEG